MGKKISKISDLSQDERNANKGTVRGSGLLEQSVQRYGLGRSVLVDKNGVLIAGNKTTEAVMQSGFDDEDVIVVPTDGTKLVVVQRTDLDMLQDTAARELGIADNRAAELNLNWDEKQIASLKSEGIDVSPFWTEKELAALLEETPEPEMSSRPERSGDEKGIPESFGVMVICKDEAEQVELLERFVEEGLSCRALTS